MVKLYSFNINYASNIIKWIFFKLINEKIYFQVNYWNVSNIWVNLTGKVYKSFKIKINIRNVTKLLIVKNYVNT